ncbi:MAG: hypothetical protein E7319_11240 [Clostridiales bacterium]|nr:hypothetical protein [Clostridiales bacterium]
MSETDRMELCFEEDGAGRQTRREEMNQHLDAFTGKTRAFAAYRFGLEDQEPYSRREAAEQFTITEERTGTLESTVFRQMGIKTPVLRSVEKLKKYLA